jgi:hypothetical protein
MKAYIRYALMVGGLGLLLGGIVLWRVYSDPKYIETRA